MPRGTRPRHTRKYEPLYALALPAVNPRHVTQSILLEREGASDCKRDGRLILIRWNEIDERLSRNIWDNGETL